MPDARYNNARDVPLTDQGRLLQSKDAKCSHRRDALLTDLPGDPLDKGRINSCGSLRSKDCFPTL